MPKPTNLNVRLTGPLSDFVAGKVGADGVYDNVSEYVRDLIRRDKDKAERQAFDRLKAELDAAFAQPLDSYRKVDVEDVIARGRRRFEARK